jgi:hypothetical protein
MVTSSRFSTAVLFSFLALAGCRADEAGTDPTSREALQKAEPLSYGCSYVHVEQSSYGTASSTDAYPACEDNVRCRDLEEPASEYVPFGDSAYQARTRFEERVDFIGTCKDQTPISCEAYLTSGDACDACVARACCSPVFLCDNDPNCGAVLECLEECGHDESCVQRCLDNGDSDAVTNLLDGVQCIVGPCADACGR